ncbi:MAG: PLP-dependent aminotransferase family protein [Vicinamibacterales bacterium]|nr:PLP-dependent aminotransferase family protein [Vicinamibacterales bacterium]
MTTPDRYLSRAAMGFQESAIRAAGVLSARVPDLVSFAAGSPSPDLFPWDDLERVAADLLRSRDPAVLQYGATRGYRPLVEAIVTRLASAGVAVSHEMCVVTTGSQQGLDLAGRVLLDPGDVVLVELPTYSGAIAAFHNLQAALVGVAQDDDGMNPEALEEALVRLAREGRRARVVYLTPNFQNPSGLLMSLARRRALLAVAARHDLIILEDDPYGSLYFEDSATAADTRPLKADDTEGRVVYLGSISKTLVPGFRVAWLVAPPAIAARVELAKQAADLCSGVFDQRVVHRTLADGIVDRLAPGLRQAYQARRTTMEESLTAALGTRVAWRRPRGGFFLWVRLGDGRQADRLFPIALEHKVSFVTGAAFHVDGGGGDYVRLSFSAPTPARIREGVARLAAAIAHYDDGV